MTIRNALIITLIAINLVGLTRALSEGSPCKANGYPGTCVLWRKCITLLLDHKNNELPPLCSLKGLEPIICCTSCTHKGDLLKAVEDPTGGYLWKTDQKSWNRCVDYFVDLPYECKSRVKGRAINEWIPSHKCFFMSEVKWEISERGERSEFPHTAMLGYMRRSDSQWRCRGTIISEKYVLTAAHRAVSPTLGMISYAAVGVQKRTDSAQIYEISSVVFPEHKPPNGIALLSTSTRIVFNKNVLPACLPNLSEPIYDEDAETIGWDEDGNIRAVMLKKLDNERCSELNKGDRNNGGYDNNTMCYGSYSNVKDVSAKNSSVKYGSVEGSLNEGSVKDVTVNYISVKDGSVEKGSLNGVSVKDVNVNYISVKDVSVEEGSVKDRNLNEGSVKYSKLNDFGGNDSPMGEVGGPLLLNVQIMRCQKTVIGIMSAGSSENTAMYTRIQPYVSWIESVVWPDPS